MKLFDLDRLNNANRAAVAAAAFRVIERNDTKSPEIQVAAAAVVFLLLCEAFKADPVEAYRAVQNMMHHDQLDGAEQHFETICTFIRHEITK